ncbi:hypothetical protein CEXT_213191 [Caerostris extrusa]|uniref:Uncharacterized protein n=1 Tax=Caerostris extrusa TaxID=172846 RepID=A0AAV4PWR4_CAEEX|nr:hypothetical protein CEXT_213191 [Caerostris extrusa]
MQMRRRGNVLPSSKNLSREVDVSSDAKRLNDQTFPFSQCNPGGCKILIPASEEPYFNRTCSEKCFGITLNTTFKLQAIDGAVCQFRRAKLARYNSSAERIEFRSLSLSLSLSKRAGKSGNTMTQFGGASEEPYFNRTCSEKCFRNYFKHDIQTANDRRRGCQFRRAKLAQYIIARRRGIEFRASLSQRAGKSGNTMTQFGGEPGDRFVLQKWTNASAFHSNKSSPLITIISRVRLEFDDSYDITALKPGECVLALNVPSFGLILEDIPLHDPALFQTEFISSTLKPTGHLIVWHQKTHQPSLERFLEDGNIPSTPHLHICLSC